MLFNCLRLPLVPIKSTYKLQGPILASLAHRHKALDQCYYYYHDYFFIFIYYLAHYTVTHRGYGAISGQNYKTVQNLPYLLDYFNY